jgi:hypothetical protein
MKYLMAGIFALALLAGCHEGRAHKRAGIARYETKDGSQILLTDGKHWYAGTKYLPPNAEPLRDFGSPVTTINGKSSECQVFGSLTFAEPIETTFKCNGFIFSVRKISDKAWIVRASCGALNVDHCESSERGPKFDYEYEFIPGEGIEWVRYVSDNPTVPGDILYHTSGDRILRKLP